MRQKQQQQHETTTTTNKQTKTAATNKQTNKQKRKENKNSNNRQHIPVGAGGVGECLTSAHDDPVFAPWMVAHKVRKVVQLSVDLPQVAGHLWVQTTRLPLPALPCSLSLDPAPRRSRRRHRWHCFPLPFLLLFLTLSPSPVLVLRGGCLVAGWLRVSVCWPCAVKPPFPPLPHHNTQPQERTPMEGCTGPAAVSVESASAV